MCEIMKDRKGSNGVKYIKVYKILNKLYIYIYLCVLTSIQCKIIAYFMIL